MQSSKIKLPLQKRDADKRSKQRNRLGNIPRTDEMQISVEWSGA
jgi:hypothetical protein